MSVRGATILRDLIGISIWMEEKIFLAAFHVCRNVLPMTTANPLNVEMIRRCWMGHLRMLTVAGGVKVHATSTDTSLLIQITSYGLAVKKVKFYNLRLLVEFSDKILVTIDLKNVLPECLKLRHSSFLDPVDCALSQWGEWSRCMNTLSLIHI